MFSLRLQKLRSTLKRVPVAFRKLALKTRFLKPLLHHLNSMFWMRTNKMPIIKFESKYSAREGGLLTVAFFLWPNLFNWLLAIAFSLLLVRVKTESSMIKMRQPLYWEFTGGEKWRPIFPGFRIPTEGFLSLIPPPSPTFLPQPYFSIQILCLQIIKRSANGGVRHCRLITGGWQKCTHDARTHAPNYCLKRIFQCDKHLIGASESNCWSSKL